MLNCPVKVPVELGQPRHPVCLPGCSGVGRPASADDGGFEDLPRHRLAVLRRGGNFEETTDQADEVKAKDAAEDSAASAAAEDRREHHEAEHQELGLEQRVLHRHGQLAQL